MPEREYDFPKTRKQHNL